MSYLMNSKRSPINFTGLISQNNISRYNDTNLYSHWDKINAEKIKQLKEQIQDHFNKEKVQSFSFDTHCLETNKKTIVNNLYPTTSFYERSGSLVSIDNLIRQHSKVINVNEKNVNNIESYYIY